MTWLQLISLLGVVALISWLGVGQLTAILAAHGIVDQPNQRTLHLGDVPRGGGLMIVCILFLALLVIGMAADRMAVFGGIAIFVLAWALLSWCDDRYDLSPRTRIMFQALLAIITVAAFGYVQFVQLSSQIVIPLFALGAVVSFLGIVWFSNLYNFIDGMDGLAASQTVIASVVTGVWLWQYGDQGLGLACWVLGAASYGFLLHNWHPASIFMGDVGSISIGAFFATVILIACHRYQLPVLSFVLLFGVIVFDTSITILRRIVRREQFWLPHRSHYYQRLAALGYRHDKIVIGLIFIMLICSVIASISLLYRDIIWLCILVELLMLVVGVSAVVRLERAAIEPS